MSDSSTRCARSVILLVAAIALTVTSALYAKIQTTTLDELVNFSDLIFYGETTHREDITHGRNVYIVRFKAESLLKEPEGLASGDIPVCENSSFQDTINLGKHPGAFVIFAKRRGPCFSPVAGYKSIIPVADGVARTGAIDEQPETERLDAFIAKIGILLKSAEQ